MRLRNITGADEIIQSNPFVIQEPGKRKENGTDFFETEKPLYLEIGMGKGRFIMELAERNPDINYIGMERYSSVLLRAIQKMEERKEPLANLKFMCEDAKVLPDIFEEGSIDRIYLNFSDPWPKDRHAKRRLPSRQFLALYDKVLKKDGRIEFKTDNRKLFDFAVEEVEAAGWKAEVITYDLHNDSELVKGNIMTEYEEKFSSIGNPICKYIIYR